MDKSSSGSVSAVDTSEAQPPPNLTISGSGVSLMQQSLPSSDQDSEVTESLQLSSSNGGISMTSVTLRAPEADEHSRGFVRETVSVSCYRDELLATGFGERPPLQVTRPNERTDAPRDEVLFTSSSERSETGPPSLQTSTRLEHLAGVPVDRDNSTRFDAEQLMMNRERVVNEGADENLSGILSHRVEPRVDEESKDEGDDRMHQLAAAQNAATRTSNIKTVKDLSDATVGRWSLRARVLSKTPIHSYNNGNTSGEVFSVLLLHSNGDEIRGTAFGAAIKILEPQLLCGSVFLVSRAKIRRAKRKFAVEGQPFELILHEDTIIQAQNDDPRIPRHRFSFCSIGDLPTLQPDAFVDIIGVVTHVEDFRMYGDTCFRSIALVDSSNTEVKCILWRELARSATSQWLSKICALKGARVSRRSGLEITTVLNTSCSIQPNLPAANVLLDWRRLNASRIPRLLDDFPWLSIAQILTSEIGSYVNFVATIQSIGEIRIIEARNGTSTRARDITLVDDTTSEITCTLWGAYADAVSPEQVHERIALQGCRLAEYQGHKLNTTQRSSITLRPIDL